LELLSKGLVWAESHLQENVLEFPSMLPEWEPIELPFSGELRPGRLALRLLPPRELTAGGIMLPSAGDGYESGAAAERCRPDCGQVIAIGGIPESWEIQAKVDKRKARELRDAKQLLRTVSIGQFVMIRPYAGLRWREKVGDVPADFCILGFDPVRNDPWADDLVMVQVGDSWRCATNWALLQMDDLTASKTVLSSRHIYSGCGVVADIGPDGSFGIGDRVATANDMHLQSPDDPKWLRTKWAGFGEDLLLVREVDAAGTRRLLARVA
jgi:hypothetical protein